MSANTVLEFFRKMEDDLTFRTAVEQDRTLENNEPRALVEVAGRMGFRFTVEDYIACIAEKHNEPKYSELVETDYLRFMRGCDTDTPSTCGCGNPAGFTVRSPHLLS